MENAGLISLAQQKTQDYRKLQESLVPNFKNLSDLVQRQMHQVLEILINKKDKKIIQTISRTGVLEESPLLRSHIWKIQLGTLGLDHNTWSQTIRKNHGFYCDLSKKIFPNEISQNIDQEIQTCRDSAQGLSSLKRSQKIISFDHQLWGEIVLDVKRTHSVLSFFRSEVHHTNMVKDKPTRHSDILSRILYIWGKVNPQIRYVQGMNELLAPLYYLESQANNKYCESEAFFMFSAIMTFSIDMHMKERDDSEYGIMGRIHTLNRYLKVVDYQLWLKLKHQKVMPQHYSFRWLALLLAQQFQLYETLRVWDVLFSFDGPKRFLYLNCLCLAIIKARRNCIMQNDMIGILPKLQKLKDLEVDSLIEVALKMYQKYSKISLQKLYDRLQMENRQSKAQENQTTYLQTKQEHNELNYVKKALGYGNMLKTTKTYITSKLPYFKNE